MHRIGKSIVLIALLAGLLSLLGGCRKNTRDDRSPWLELQHGHLQVDGLNRRYAMYVPKNAGGKAMPLVIELHGGGIYIEGMTGESGRHSPYRLWMELADRENFIVVYPEGENGSYGKPSWNDCRADAPVNSRADDVRFITQLIEHISTTQPMDTRRVYVSGTSNGGLMALRLAIEIPERIAAVAAVAAAMPARSACPEPEQPLSVLFMNGTDDNRLPWKGGVLSDPPNPRHGSVMSTEASVALWRRLDQTEATPRVYNFPDLDPDDGSTVTRYIWNHGLNGTDVVLYKIDGGGHSAPSIREQYSQLYEHFVNRQNHDIEMTTEVWHFFRDKRR